MLKDKYINPFTDFGFKKLFGEETSKELLINFLNQLLPPKHTIAELQYRQTEQLGSTIVDRKAVFDLYCENERGDKFIVELQKAKQNYFKDRSVFYSTFPIQEQAEKGDWDFKLNAVYCIGILDFVFEEDKDYPDKYMYQVSLMDHQTQKIFYDKLHFIYLEMPKFTKTEAQLENDFDRWLYFLKHLPDLDEIPHQFRTHIFLKAFEIAEIAHFDRSQQQDYERSLKYYRDLKNVVDTSFEEGVLQGIQEGMQKGRQEGRQEGIETMKLELARNMKAAGEPLEKIQAYTGLNPEAIAAL